MYLQYIRDDQSPCDRKWKRTIMDETVNVVRALALHPISDNWEDMSMQRAPDLRGKIAVAYRYICRNLISISIMEDE